MHAQPFQGRSTLTRQAETRRRFQTATSVGYGGTLNQLVNSAAPDKGIGLTLTIPLRNREAQANQVRAELEYRQAQVRLSDSKTRLVSKCATHNLT